VIQDFRDGATERLWNGETVKRFTAIRKVALRKLDMLHAAVAIGDLASPPGNRLEALVGDRAGRHSIRINDQFRICFVWTDKGPTQVEIVDYH
jgi:toxin HigB-1